jgi:integrase
MHFHDLRHNASMILLSSGIPMKTVQEILGHGDIRTTMNIYGHVLPSTPQDAMDDMDEWFGYDENKEENNPDERE